MLTGLLAGALVAPAESFATGEPLQSRWSRVFLGFDYLEATADVGDFDGDAWPDLLVGGCRSSCWVILTKGGDGYRQLTSTTPSVSTLSWIRRSSVPEGPELVLALRGQEMEISRLEGGSIETQIVALTANSPRDAAISDIDADGDLELVVLDPFDLFVHDLSSGDLIETRFGLGGTDLEIGQLDLDLPPEIVIATSYGSCWVLDGASLGVDWGSPSECGTQVRLGQLLPDAPLEILTNPRTNWYDGVLRAFDPPALPPLWTTDPFPGERVTFATAELSELSLDEILVGGSGSSSTWILRGTDGSALWSIAGTASRDIDAGDLDSDGRTEIVSLDEYGGLGLRDAQTGEIESLGPNFGYSSTSCDAADVDLDGDFELVTGGWWLPENETEGPLAAALYFPGNGSGSPIPRVLDPTNYWFGDIGDLRIGEVDGDAGPELCSAFSVGPPMLSCDDLPDLDDLWTNQGSPLAGPLTLGDIVGDAREEVIAMRSWSDSETIVAAHNGGSGSIVWESENLAPQVIYPSGVCLGPIAGLESGAMVALGWSPSFAILDSSDGSTIDFIEAEESFTVLGCADLEGTGQLFLLGADEEGQVGRIDAATGQVAETYIDLDEWIFALATADFTGAGSPQIAIATGDGLRIIDPDSGAIVWSEDGAFSPTSYTGFLVAVDVDGDSRIELVAGSAHGIHVFGRAYAGEVLLVDGFESGTAAAWPRSPL